MKMAKPTMEKRGGRRRANLVPHCKVYLLKKYEARIPSTTQSISHHQMLILAQSN
jgi:hypothetical protein